MTSIPPLQGHESGFDLAPANPAARTLLIVDDDASVREALSFLFRGEYNLLSAENGSAAIELVRRHIIDVAILDIRMPGLSGIETLGELKKIEPTIEVIILTAYEAIDTARQALRLGACDYLSKPFEVETMRAAVANAVERRDVSNEIQAHNKKLVELQDEIHNQQLREELARTRTDIYASILHDINGPLTIISGFIDIITDQLADLDFVGGTDLEMVKKHLDAIMRQVNNCIQISRRYLGFLQSRSGTNSQVGINQILADLGQLLQVHPQSRSHTLVIQPLPQDVSARINGTDLIQILLNLTINALQCTPQPHTVELSGILLRETPQLDEVDADDLLINAKTLRHPGPLVALSVTDNGPGIARDMLGRIFEPYFTTKPLGQGTGLGLSIVRRLIEQSHGAIRLHSKVGEGTTFTVYLPV